MPAPRAVLEALEKFGLRSDKAYSLVRSDGTLRPVGFNSEDILIVAPDLEGEPVNPEPVKPAVVQEEAQVVEVAEEPALEPVVEELVEKPTLVEEPKTEATPEPVKPAPAPEKEVPKRKPRRKKAQQADDA